MSPIGEQLDRLADETGFSGVVRVDRGDTVEFVGAYGLADRGHRIAMTPQTQLAMASGSKGFTALAVMSLVQDGVLTLATTARSILGDDLPLIGEDVTVEHLLAHRSGIGDYLDDHADAAEYVLRVPVHELTTTEQYLVVLAGHPGIFRAGERFCYCNAGFVVLALLAERASGVPFHDLVRHRVCAPAGMTDTDFLRSDDLPGRAALGYLEVDGHSRTNVFHLPVLGNGDGGMFTTAQDMQRFWNALFAGRIVAADTVAEMTRPRSDFESASNLLRHGLGFWLYRSGHTVFLEGCDAGVSFRSVHDPAARLTLTVLANTIDGAWPIASAMAGRYAPSSERGR